MSINVFLLSSGNITISHHRLSLGYLPSKVSASTNNGVILQQPHWMQESEDN